MCSTWKDSMPQWNPPGNANTWTITCRDRRLQCPWGCNSHQGSCAGIAGGSLLPDETPWQRWFLSLWLGSHLFSTALERLFLTPQPTFSARHHSTRWQTYTESLCHCLVCHPGLDRGFPRIWFWRFQCILSILWILLLKWLYQII